MKSFDITLGHGIELHKGNLFWISTTDKARFYPELDYDISCDICIIGGGMSGAILSHQLSTAGFQVAVLDKMQPATGSSLGNTGMIQYHSDRGLKDFIQIEGNQAGRDFYQLCHDAMMKLDDIVYHLEEDVGYRPIESIYITDEIRLEDEFRQEAEVLMQHDFPAEYLSKDVLKQKYGLSGEHGMLTRHDATLNPYKMIHALLAQAMTQGGQIYGNSPVRRVVRRADETKITVSTDKGYTVTADHVIFCTGYLESFDALRGKDKLHSTYSLVTHPIEGELWDQERMIWDAKEAYLYFRVTEDHRIIVGGLDEDNPELQDMTIINRKAGQLMEQMKRYYPELEAEPHYIWQSVFGVSRDEKPFIGRDPELDHVYYALGYGGNGTCYSLAAADIILSQLRGQQHPYAYVVAPGR